MDSEIPKTINGGTEKNTGSAPIQQILENAVQRILSVVKPQRIILFGSVARGEIGPDSDLDFLVVMPNGTHRRKTSVEILRALRGIGMPKDVIVATEQDLTIYGNNASLVLKPALAEGKDLYASA